MSNRGLDIDVQGRHASSEPIPGRSSASALPWTKRAIADVATVLVGAVSAFFLLDPLEAGFAILWWVVAVVVIRSDLERFIIPDWASATIAGLGLAHAVTAAAAPDGWALDAIGAAVMNAVLSASIAFAFFWAVAWGYRRRAGREGLGFGDVKLAGASAVWLGYVAQVAALEVACVAAIAVVLMVRRRPGERMGAIPFGAFLAPSAWLVFVVGPLAYASIGRLA